MVQKLVQVHAPIRLVLALSLTPPNRKCRARGKRPVIGQTLGQMYWGLSHGELYLRLHKTLTQLPGTAFPLFLMCNVCLFNNKEVLSHGTYLLLRPLFNQVEVVFCKTRQQDDYMEMSQATRLLRKLDHGDDITSVNFAAATLYLLPILQQFASRVVYHLIGQDIMGTRST